MVLHRARRVAILATIVVGALSASPVAAASGTQVDGLLTPDTNAICTEDAGSVATYTVTGDLSGCWYIDEWTINNETPSGSTQASGTEMFSGWFNGQRGHFWTEYTFTYRIVDGAETHGRCHHPIVGGDGVFAGVKGVIQMHDLPSGCAVYHGFLRF